MYIIPTFLLFALLLADPQAAPLPAEIVMASASYSDHPGEKWAGTLSFAQRLSIPAQSYSYTSLDIQAVIVKGKPSFSDTQRTGMALLVPQLSHGNFYVFVLGTAGATIINASALASGSVGTLAGYRIGKHGILWGDFQNSNTTGKTARIGGGFAWGK